jgi:hypothetical protein
MLFQRVLRHPPLRSLWLAEWFSSIGDELYFVSLVWVTVGLIGSDAGYLSFFQTASILLITLFAGAWADRWSLPRILIGSDLLRGFLVLLPVVFNFAFGMFHTENHFQPTWIPITVLAVTSILVAAVSGFFRPAHYQLLPHYCENPSVLKETNGLMATTSRSARVLGPVMIGALIGVLSPLDFFVLDALSYFLSAYLIYHVMRKSGVPKFVRSQERVIQSLKNAWILVREDAAVFRIYCLKIIMSGSWNLGYSLGIVMWVKQNSTDLSPKTFGAVMGAYGVGNLLSAIIYGSSERKNSESLVYRGFAFIGVGFVILGFSRDPFWMAVGAAICAFGGPMNDLPVTDMIQHRYPHEVRAKLFRLRMSVETGSNLIGMLLGPFLFRVYSPGKVIMILGALVLGCATYGAVAMRKK